MQQSQSSSNMLEMKSIFQLFDLENNQEIDIKQINQLLRGLEMLSVQQTGSPAMQPTQSTQGAQPSQHNMNLPPMYQGNFGRRLTLSKKVNSSDNLEETHGIKQDKPLDSPQPSQQSPSYVSVTELKYFPNNKTTMSFPDFCDIFNECMSNRDQHDELLQSSFAVFDYDENGYIDSKKIKQVFEVFKDKTSVEEIQNVLKFCGVVNDKMTLNEFKEFFKKNL